MSLAYISSKSRTERHRKTKIGTEVVHISRVSDSTFKVRSQGRGIVWQPHYRLHSLFDEQSVAVKSSNLLQITDNVDNLKLKCSLHTLCLLYIDAEES